MNFSMLGSEEDLRLIGSYVNGLHTRNSLPLPMLSLNFLFFILHRISDHTFSPNFVSRLLKVTKSPQFNIELHIVLPA